MAAAAAGHSGSARPRRHFEGRSAAAGGPGEGRGERGGGAGRRRPAGTPRHNVRVP